MSTPTISASSRAVFSSFGVQVGERKSRVSEMIADIRRPAVVRSISTPLSRYIIVMIVEQHPSGWFRKYTGDMVCTAPILW